MIVRLHYSVDVLLAVILAFFVHHAYYISLEEAVRSQWHNCDGSKFHSPNAADQYTLVVETKEVNANLGNNVAECVISIEPEDDAAPVNENERLQVISQAQSAEDDAPDCSTLASACAVHCKYPETNSELAGKHIHQVDTAMLLNNRRPTMYLPNIVAWMDGLRLR
ncbi:hypothetical protein H4R20_000026 [Coemansia guatemalensis]|uniref:Uncharacterized protein n=1 Tax=Coemansia guatemalensis TaxID=2761395 RepID=A0A9W8I1Q3_9FUNG|nr:hypothetical protein H4R20_000026 [Coemansia guatemalensis]